MDIGEKYFYIRRKEIFQLINEPSSPFTLTKNGINGKGFLTIR